VACGLNTDYSDVDAYASAAAGIEESLRNLVCVGAQIDRVALLDNFSWAKCTDPAVFGALVRACQACYDLAKYYNAPFISGKDSLSNEFTYAGKTIKIPHTLLITAMTVMNDVRKAITMDVKRVGDRVVVVGLTKDELGRSEYLATIGGTGGSVPRFDRTLSKPVLKAVASCTASQMVNAAHDASEGGLAVTFAEMAFSGGFGMEIDAEAIPGAADLPFDRLLFSESLSRIVITVPADRFGQARSLLSGVPHAVVGTVIERPELVINGRGATLRADLAGLKAAWQGGMHI
jgi:phosphoribosylformylglycinamidine synthase subunit PurSL